MKLVAVLAMLLVASSCSRILVILDNKSLKTTHSEFFELLERGNELEFAFSFEKHNIELKYYDRFRYDHIIVMCTSAKGNL